MKETNNFSAEDKEKTSLNFLELRQKGLDYIQGLSGNVWTDFNSHDPGVTILEQLCYGLTDVSLRTTTEIKDLLTPKNERRVNSKKNGFYAPSEIYRTHPVTILDVRKAILDNFSEIQNVWIKPIDNNGFEEKLVVTERINVLPKLSFNTPQENFYSPNSKFKKEIKRFVSEIRNIGEDVDNICFLQPKNITIKIEIYLVDQKNIEKTLANLFLKLFEYIYSPVPHFSLEEMTKQGISMSDIFSGPRLSNGFIKDDSLQERMISINSEEIKQVLSNDESIYKCVVNNLYAVDNKKEDYSEKKHILKVTEDEFFHLLEGEETTRLTIESFSRLYKNMIIKINDKEVKLSKFMKEKIHHLLFDLWSKKYRQYSLEDTQNEKFNRDLQGTYQNTEEYYSIQNHFPLIYGIGKEGLPKSAPKEQHAKAKQLKAYLLLFEQYLANHLSQVSHIDDFFNINFKDKINQTYFQQPLTNIHNINELIDDSSSAVEEKEFYRRKNKIYNHLLARFGEDLKPIPWKNSYQENLKKNELKNALLERKSNYLLNIENLTADRIKGECFSFSKNKEAKRQMSGLENVLLSKTGINPRHYRSLNEISKKGKTFYVVDHILLRGFLYPDGNENVSYGFKIVDALGEVICKTKKEEPWCSEKKGRYERLTKLYTALSNPNIFENDDKNISKLKYKDIQDPEDSTKTLVTFTDKLEKYKVLDLLYLFDASQPSNERSRLREIEKIRAKGIESEKFRGLYGQRRLVFQRKIKKLISGEENVVIDEDFFNLSISIVLPILDDSFENDQFESYMEDLIIERVPSHIHANRLWLNKTQMSKFENIYHKWENLKVWENAEVEEDKEEALKKAKELKEASYYVYDKIIKLIEKKDS